MFVYKMTETELQFAELIWDHEPLKSGELVELASKELNWKKSTTYTVLRKLCDNEIFVNNNSVVTGKVGKEEYRRLLGEEYLAKNYSGSLPSFVAAFVKKKRLNKQEIEEIKKIIDSYECDGE